MNNTKNIMIIYGSEAYLMEEGRRQFFEAARKRSGGDAEVQTFQKDAAAASVVESFQGTSLFSSGTITVWYDCPFLPLKRGGRSRSKVSKEEQWFLDEAGRLDDGNSLLFYSKGNVDTGSAFFKALKPMAQVVAAEAVSEKKCHALCDSLSEETGQEPQPRRRRFFAGLVPDLGQHLPALRLFRTR